MSVRTCTVTVKDLEGIRHSVDVAAESLYEAAALGVALFYQHEWGKVITPLTQIQVAVAKEPAATHSLTFDQLQRWSASGGSPNEIIKKKRVKALITNGRPEPEPTKPRGWDSRH